MIKDIIKKLWASRAQFAKYFLVGLSALFLDVGSLYLLKEYARLRPVAAVAINQVFMVAYVFLLNKYWSFGARGCAATQAARFLVVMFLNYIIAIGWMWFFNEKFGLDYRLARVANIAVAVAWNFLLYKYWVYANGFPLAGGNDSGNHGDNLPAAP